MDIETQRNLAIAGLTLALEGYAADEDIGPGPAQEALAKWDEYLDRQFRLAEG